MSVIVTDTGFQADDWTGTIVALPERTGESGVDISSDTAWSEVAALLPGVDGFGVTEPARGRGPGGAPDGGEGEVRESVEPGGKSPEMIRIEFPSFADGRGFTLARRLRQAGFSGRLRARGHILADQYAMARRSGFDEVEIADDMARRQPEGQWRARAHWRAHDYQSRLGARPSVAAR